MHIVCIRLSIASFKKLHKYINVNNAISDIDLFFIIICLFIQFDLFTIRLILLSLFSR